jgi:hypothetical protein
MLGGGPKFVNVVPQYDRYSCFIQKANGEAIEKAELVAGWFLNAVWNQGIRSFVNNIFKLAKDHSPSPMQWLEPIPNETKYDVEALEVLLEEHIKVEGVRNDQFKERVNHLEEEQRKLVKEQIAQAIKGIAEFEAAQKRLNTAEDKLEKVTLANVEAGAQVAHLTEAIHQQQQEALSFLEHDNKSA